MSTTDQFLMAMKAYQEIRTELQHEDHGLVVIPPSETLYSHGASTPSIPGGSLMLGLAEDGLPLLLDLYDPAPGPLLIADDQGSGKTSFLKWLAHASDFGKPGDIQFGVVTPFPEEWSDIENLPNALGIWPVYHPSAHQFLSKLANWSETLSKTRQVILILVDGLDLLTGNSFYLQQELWWLLSNGPAKNLWPVVSTNPAHLSRMVNWLSAFHTRILGRVKYMHNARLLTDDSRIHLDDLIPGIEFILSQPGNFLKFLLPPLSKE